MSIIDVAERIRKGSAQKMLSAARLEGSIQGFRGS